MSPKRSRTGFRLIVEKPVLVKKMKVSSPCCGGWLVSEKIRERRPHVSRVRRLQLRKVRHRGVLPRGSNLSHGNKICYWVGYTILNSCLLGRNNLAKIKKVDLRQKQEITEAKKSTLGRNQASNLKD